MKNLPRNQKNLVLYFQVHQPWRLRRFRFFDIGSGTSYFDDALNREIMERVARECYLPANALLLRLIRKHRDIRVAFSISGLALEQMEEYTPEVLLSFRALAETGCVEFLAETQYHSLACLLPGEEFEEQVRAHAAKIREHFNAEPAVFRNTELIYSDEIGARVSRLGFKGVFCDGIEKILGFQTPHRLYSHPSANLSLLLRNYRLSDDIAFRFSNASAPLTAEQYLTWLNGIPAQENLINIAMDYETFGEHQKRSSGIFTFLETLLTSLSKDKKFRMMTPSQAVSLDRREHVLSVPDFVSWADRERDLSAWLGNPIQQDAFDTLASLGPAVKQLGDPLLLKCWRLLQTSDHFYYMCTKKDDDGNVHSYFSPYPSPYEAFINYMNVLSDFTMLINKRSTLLQARKEALVHQY